MQTAASRCSARPSPAVASTSRHVRPFVAVRSHQIRNRRLRLECQAETKEMVPVKLPRSGFMLSKTEVPAFIPRDDMMDQMVRWALIEAEEGGQRNFGMPMKVHQRFLNDKMWGIELEIIKEGEKQAELSFGFDNELTHKSEWIGQDSSTGMPTKEGKQEEVVGKHFEIWKTCDRKVDEDLRATIRAFCTGLVAALNKYYAFGSVFAEEV